MDYENTQEYKDYLGIVDDLNAYRMLNPMTEDQANNFRHQAGSARMAQKHGLLKSNLWGLLKEGYDLIKTKQPFKDSMVDLKNNIYGSFVGASSKQMPESKLYEYIYNGVTK